jgi:hypothetical protein
MASRSSTRVSNAPGGASSWSPFQGYGVASDTYEAVGQVLQVWNVLCLNVCCSMAFVSPLSSCLCVSCICPFLSSVSFVPFGLYRPLYFDLFCHAKFATPFCFSSHRLPSSSCRLVNRLASDLTGARVSVVVVTRLIRSSIKVRGTSKIPMIAAHSTVKIPLTQSLLRHHFIQQPGEAFHQL